MAILLADIGGTNARFSWLDKKKIGSIKGYSANDFKNPYDAISHFIHEEPQKLEGIALAGAGPLQGTKLSWTNRKNWKVSKLELQKKYHIKKVLIVNDLQAQGEGLKTICKTDKTTLLMTAGTGLGACFIVNNQVIPSEVGQIKKESHLKIEDIISGPGIVCLYHEFGGDKNIKSARLIDELRLKKDKIARKTYRFFYQEWGKLSARLATLLCTAGGVYIWGGLIPKTKEDKRIFSTTFQKTLPTVFLKFSLHFINEKNLTFKGLAVLSNREFGQS